MVWFEPSISHWNRRDRSVGGWEGENCLLSSHLVQHPSAAAAVPSYDDRRRERTSFSHWITGVGGREATSSASSSKITP